MKCTAAEGKTLVGQVVQFTDAVEQHEMDFDTGMLARIKDIREDNPDDPTWKVYIFVMDFSEFEEQNKSKMQPNYYDKNRVPCETWAEQPTYKESLEKGHSIYLQFEEDNSDKLYELPFETIETDMPVLIVCAAMRSSKTGAIICGARHYDPIMHETIKAMGGKEVLGHLEQGFIDQRGNFLTRAESHIIAEREYQIRRRCGGDTKELFSENLY